MPKSKFFYAYLGLIILLLVGAVSFTALHEKGYRIKGFSITKAGTILMKVSEPETWIFIGNEPLRKTVAESEDLNIPNVDPGKKLVTVIKNDYFPWAKKVDVPSGESLTLYPFLLKQDVKAQRISSEHPDFLKAIRAFQSLETQTSYTTDINSVSVSGNQILIECSGQTCNNSPITLEIPVRSISQFRSNPNVVIYNTGTEMHVSELSADLRISYKIFEGQNIRFFSEGDTLYVQSAGSYYKISL